LAERLGVSNFHLFFLVPTGRGTDIQDITPQMYEEMITKTLAKTTKYKLNVKPSCAPQFMRVAKDQGVDMSRWVRGCMAGLYYCRIYPSGEVTPCPYMPVSTQIKYRPPASLAVFLSEFTLFSIDVILLLDFY